MKKLNALLIILFLFLASTVVAFVPFAPTADIPANPDNDPDLAWAISSIKRAAFLEESEVGLPPYPGAHVVQTEDGQGKVLPMVCLITSDGVSDVMTYYKQKLSDWEYGDNQGETILWQGTREEALHGETLTIRISEAKLFQGLQAAETEIRIWYIP